MPPLKVCTFDEARKKKWITETNIHSYSGNSIVRNMNRSDIGIRYVEHASNISRRHIALSSAGPGTDSRESGSITRD